MDVSLTLDKNKTDGAQPISRSGKEESQNPPEMGAPPVHLVRGPILYGAWVQCPQGRLEGSIYFSSKEAGR